MSHAYIHVCATQRCQHAERYMYFLHGGVSLLDEKLVLCLVVRGVRIAEGFNVLVKR